MSATSVLVASGTNTSLFKPSVVSRSRPFSRQLDFGVNLFNFGKENVDFGTVSELHTGDAGLNQLAAILDNGFAAWRHVLPERSPSRVGY